MAVVAVVFDGARVNDAEATTGWTAEGVTPVLENDFFYQGVASISAQIKTTEAGFYYTSASTNMTGRSWLAKVYSGKTAGLSGNGLTVRIGSGTGAYHQYNLFTATSYPFVGGWQVVAINPNVAQWRSSTTGSPNLAAVIYWAARAQYNAVSRATNTAVDALDHIANGTGLTLTGGDGADDDATFLSFIAADEGNSSNRWGVISAKSGILYALGTLIIGTATAAGFTDANRVVVFTDQLVTTGFCGIKFNLSNAATSIALTNCVLNGRGALYTADDTRPDYTVTGTSGTLTLTGCTFNGYRLITLTSKPVIQECSFLNGGAAIIAAGADLRGSSFSGSLATAALSWNVAIDTNGKLDNCAFISSGTGHAIELGASTPNTISLQGLTFTGYGADGTTNAAIYNNSGKALTINIVDGGSPTVRNGTGASTTLVTGQRSFAFNVVDATGTALTGYEWRLYTASATPGKLADTELDGEETAASSSQNYLYTYTVDTDVVLQVIHDGYTEYILRTEFLDSDQSTTVVLQAEENT